MHSPWYFHYLQVVKYVQATTLTEEQALQMRAKTSCIDAQGKKRWDKPFKSSTLQGTQRPSTTDALLSVCQRSRQRKFLRVVRQKILAVRKIMETMRTYASQHVSNYSSGKRWRKAREYGERKARIVCEEHFYFAESFDEPGGKGAFKMSNSFLYLFSLVRISEFMHANFSSTCVRCTHLLKS